MKKRVGINGFGRIGRNFYRASLQDKEFRDNFEIVAVNDITDSRTLAHLLKYDSVLRKLDNTIEVEENAFTVDGKRIEVLRERNPSSLPWKNLEVEYVLEATGLFTHRDDASKHIDAGAKKVVITAPAKKPDIMIVLGVNHENYDPVNHKIISMA
ncbi:glyceraldehyde 3-phosphate dehydrogenase NAD-binding domain-containing protein, partial [[Eubacterium] cellulosolvens]